MSANPPTAPTSANPPTQYATDENLALRQRLWAASRREPALDLFAWVLALAGLDAGGSQRVLDIGCGNGSYESALADRAHTGGRVALDLSAGMLAAVTGAARVQADAQALPFAPGAFDVVLAPHMLYHVPDVALAAAEARRVLRPGGVFVAVTNGRAHLSELRALVEAAVGTGWRMEAPAATAFSLEDGAAPLAAAFASVERVDCPPGHVAVVDADALGDYVASVGDHYEDEAGVPWSAVVARVRDLAGAAVARDGALRISAATGAFVCR
jgi:SAM-dependent methyltransferase